MTPRASFRVLQITALPFPPEIRVVKEGLSLREAGYCSAVLCPPIPGRPPRENWRGIDVFRPDVLRRATTKPDKVLYHSAFFSPAWRSAIREVAREYRPHVLHVHDVWLGRSAFAARSDQKIVMDLHENMPAAVVEYRLGYRGGHRLFTRVFKSYGRVLAYERGLLARSDLVLGVVEEAVRRIRETHPDLPPDRVVNVENLESREFVAAPPTAQRVIADDHFSVLYIGGFGPHRGIDTVIRAMRHLRQWRVNARFHIVGAKEGSSYLAMLRELIEAEGVEDMVSVRGWVPASEVLNHISQASCGTVPHQSNPHTDTTIPHKLFQYMIAARPVLVSTSPPLARSVRAAGAGLVFTAGDPMDCAQKIRELAEQPACAREYGRAGRRYVLEHGHNWEEESAPALIAAYDRLLGATAAA